MPSVRGRLDAQPTVGWQAAANGKAHIPNEIVDRVEEQLDAELNKLEHMDEDEMEALVIILVRH